MASPFRLALPSLARSGVALGHTTTSIGLRHASRSGLRSLHRTRGYASSTADAYSSYSSGPSALRRWTTRLGQSSESDIDSRARAHDRSYPSSHSCGIRYRGCLPTTACPPSLSPILASPTCQRVNPRQSDHLRSREGGSGPIDRGKNARQRRLVRDQYV